MKGKPWTSEQEKHLRELVEAKTSLAVIAKKLEKTEESVRSKIRRLGLEEDDHKKIICSSSSSKYMPAELPSIEEMLKKLVAAVNALETPGLDRSEVLRLRGIIAGVNSYQALLGEYLDYRGIEAELLELRKKFDDLEK